MGIVIGKIVVEKQPQACDTCIFYFESFWPYRPWDIDAGCIVACVLDKEDTTLDEMLFELANKGLCPFYENIDAYVKSSTRKLSDEELEELAQRKINTLMIEALRRIDAKGANEDGKNKDS